MDGNIVVGEVCEKHWAEDTVLREPVFIISVRELLAKVDHLEPSSEEISDPVAHDGGQGHLA